MALYIRFEDVAVRVEGKIRFTSNPENEPNKMPVKLAMRLINEAEGEVELDLSERYAVPFQTNDGGAFKDLPVRPTKEILRLLCELKAVIRMLETDFGRGTATDGDKYQKKQEERYKAVRDTLLAKRDNSEKSYVNWLKPPLDGLRLALHNEVADDGYAGFIVNTSQSPSGGAYPAQQINDPSRNFWTPRESEVWNGE